MPRPELDAMGFGFIRAVGGSCHVVVRRAMYGIGESIEREFDSYTDDFGATPALATLDRAEPVRQAGNGALCELPTHALPFSLDPTPTSCGVDLVNRGHGAGGSRALVRRRGGSRGTNEVPLQRPQTRRTKSLAGQWDDGAAIALDADLLTNGQGRRHCSGPASDPQVASTDAQGAGFDPSAPWPKTHITVPSPPNGQSLRHIGGPVAATSRHSSVVLKRRPRIAGAARPR